MVYVSQMYPTTYYLQIYTTFENISKEGCNIFGQWRILAQQPGRVGEVVVNRAVVGVKVRLGQNLYVSFGSGAGHLWDM